MSATAHGVSGSKFIFMPEGYCVKCKAKKEIIDGVEEVMKNGRKAIKGKCPTCGTVMFKILGGKATPAAISSEPAAAGAEPAKPSSTPK
jgi:Zn finger protein HypA/HybF involved in hydrogenase expression